MKKIKFNILAIVCIIIFCISLAPKQLQNDTFYTIKIGEYVAQNGIGNLTNDPFSWHNLPYTFPHWLYDTLIFSIYNIGGLDGLYISTMVFASILGILIYIVSNKLSKNQIVSFVVTLGAMYLMRPYIAVRAQLVTFILFVFTIFCIEKFLEKKGKLYGILLVLIPILIANLHLAVWPFYFVLFLPYIGEYIISSNIFSFNTIIKIKMFFIKRLKYKDKNKQDILLEKLNSKIEDNNIKRAKTKENPYKIRVRRLPRVKYLILIMIIALFTGLLTPTGLTTPYTYLYKTMTGNTTNVINEHLPLVLRSAPEFCCSIIIFLLLLIFTDIKINLKNLFFLGGLLFLSFYSRRQISMYTIICAPILAELFSDLFKKYFGDLEERLLSVFVSLIGKILILIMVVLLALNIYKPKRNDNYINDKSYPVYAAKWIKENLDYKYIRLFNEYNYGSYLLMQDIPVMIDSRCDLYTPQFNSKTGDPKDGIDIFTDVQNTVTLTTFYENTFNKYDITHVILYRNSKLAMLLRRNMNYKNLYEDDSFVIFERNI